MNDMSSRGNYSVPESLLHSHIHTSSLLAVMLLTLIHTFRKHACVTYFTSLASPNFLYVLPPSLLGFLIQSMFLIAL